MNSSEGTQSALKISVIMPVYNGVPFIKKSLPPLIAMLHRNEIAEVIVVDDTSSDETIAVAEQLGAKVIPSGGRLGPGGARNEAAKEAIGDLLWFVDADVIVHDDAVQKMIGSFDDESVVAVFGTYDDKPPAENFLSQYKNLVHHFYHVQAKKEASTFWSGCGVIRKDKFLEQEGFDVITYTRPSIEDIELGYRLIAAGGKILLLKDFLSTHLKVWKFINLVHTEIFCRAIPWSRLMLNQTGMVDDLNVGTGERIKAGVAGLFFLCAFLSLIGVIHYYFTATILLVAFLVNKDLFSLFYRRKGLLFMFGGLFYHQFYYLYSTTAFVYCYVEKMLLGKGAT